MATMVKGKEGARVREKRLGNLHHCHRLSRFFRPKGGLSHDVPTQDAHIAHTSPKTPEKQQKHTSEETETHKRKLHPSSPYFLANLAGDAVETEVTAEASDSEPVWEDEAVPAEWSKVSEEEGEGDFTPVVRTKKNKRGAANNRARQEEQKRQTEQKKEEQKKQTEQKKEESGKQGEREKGVGARGGGEGKFQDEWRVAVIKATEKKIGLYIPNRNIADPGIIRGPKPRMIGRKSALRRIPEVELSRWTFGEIFTTEKSLRHLAEERREWVYPMIQGERVRETRERPPLKLVWVLTYMKAFMVSKEYCTSDEYDHSIIKARYIPKNMPTMVSNDEDRRSNDWTISISCGESGEVETGVASINVNDLRWQDMQYRFTPGGDGVMWVADCSMPQYHRGGDRVLL